MSVANEPGALVRSFEADDRNVTTSSNGARAHVLHQAHLERLHRRFYTVKPGVWCLVGNGLSNQTFIEAPEGIIAIDTGECVEEMRAALKELRAVTDKPVVAVMYTHFHYVGGTRAIFEEAGRRLPVHAHEGVVANRARVSDEIGPFYSRGLVEQFGLNLPAEGPDALLHVGLGLAFRFPEHAPFTPGFEAPTVTTATATSWTVAGLQVDVTPAPSDASDSVTFWFPSLRVALQNLVWPALFNIFAIRGEEYRDPRVLLQGLDHLRQLGADHLLGAHGPPMDGRQDIAARTLKYRDAIQFLWDQTVRGMNRGWTADELAERVRLPATYDADYITAERYGVAEHHVRQIHSGLKGWFDGDPAKLFPLPPAERARRLVEGFGGYVVVRKQADAALSAGDVRWATELCSWLVKCPAGSTVEQEADRKRLAACLRRIGQGSPAANIRSWALTSARDLEGVAPMDRFRQHRFRRAAVMENPCASVQVLRVLLDPDRAAGIDHHVRLEFVGGHSCGVHVRNSVACPTNGRDAHSVLSLSPESWADFLTGKALLRSLVQEGRAGIQGEPDAVLALWDCFDISASK
jgi:alkyl sulfatase BDS1-like metallo-beta-lactamase superfamily hydrolase